MINLSNSFNRMNRQPAAKAAAILAALVVLAPMPAMAAAFDIPFITQFGCQVIQWMKGPLAVMIWVVVTVATLVIGMIAKMDWSRIIQVCGVFGIVVGLGSILAGSSFLQSAPMMSSCLA